MTIGTSHFSSVSSACIYYRAYGYDSKDVARKISDGEISIGRPVLKIGEKLSIDSDGRYQITVKD